MTGQGESSAPPPHRRGARRKSFVVRLPPELHDELKAWASAELRSLNAHVEFLLREAVRRKKGNSREDPSKG